MADEIDKTMERDELEAPARMAATKRPVGPEANGHCHWCSERIPEPMRWCDADCRNEYDEALRRALMRGS
jgi:hypothetical protein